MIVVVLLIFRDIAVFCLHGAEVDAVTIVGGLMAGNPTGGDGATFGAGVATDAH
jgi:hypothetical protein